jgi:glucose-1-phosphate adenylyltransferase
VVKGGNIRNSVIRHEVMIEPDVDIEDCIIMDYSFIGSGSRLRRAIIGRYNLIEPATVIGYLPTSDRQRYPISPSGIVVVPKGSRGQIRVY